MYTPMGVGFAGLMALAAATGGQDVQENVLVIDGTSTVRDWTCEAGRTEVEVTPASAFADLVMAGEKAVRTVRIAVPVADIGCGNGTMDKHLRNALEVEDNPEVVFELTTYDLQTTPDQTVLVSARGELTIAGTTRPVDMDVTVRRTADGKLRVQGEEAITMTEYGVTPPRLMMGALKVGPDVQVRFDVTLN